MGGTNKIESDKVLVKSFLDEGIDINKDKIISDVSEQTSIEVRNVLKEDKLTKILLTSMKHGIVHLTDDLSNNFELEKEIKILDIPKYKSIDSECEFLGLDGLCYDLVEELGAIKSFEGKITDRYFDYPDERLDKGSEKISFRIRKKTDFEGHSVFYFTIKRKEEKNDDSDELRVCYEKEYLITDVMAFQNIIKDNGFIETRRKEKDRVAYSLDSIKFDIDTYNGIPTLMEIEAKSTRIAMRYMKILKLKKHETLISGSRGLYKHYDMIDEYKFIDNKKT